MARKKATPPPDEEPAGGEEQPKTKRHSVTIDPDLIRQIRILAADSDTSPPNWINNKLRQVVTEEWPRILSQLNQE